ncbi:MAG: HEAT repeat domain-containing protein [Nitrospiraceae bacterium]
MVSAEPSNASPGSLMLSVRGDSMSVKIDQVSLREVLAELARQVPLTVYVAGPAAEEPVAMTFRNLPFEKGVKRILEGKQYVLIHDPPHSANGTHAEGRIVKILIMPKVGSPSGMAPMETKLPKPSVAPYPNRQPVKLGSNGLRLEQLRRQALEAKNPTDRAEALEALSDQGKDAEVLPILATALQDEDPSVRELAKELLNDHEKAASTGP